MAGIGLNAADVLLCPRVGTSLEQFLGVINQKVASVLLRFGSLVLLDLRNAVFLEEGLKSGGVFGGGRA